MCTCADPDLLAEFSCSETGGADGEVGDQTGRESSVHAYYDYPWDCTLHYNGKADGTGGTATDPQPAAQPDASEIAAKVVDEMARRLAG